MATISHHEHHFDIKEDELRQTIIRLFDDIQFMDLSRIELNFAYENFYHQLVKLQQEQLEKDLAEAMMTPC